jgi:hypothetical protein
LKNGIQERPEALQTTPSDFNYRGNHEIERKKTENRANQRRQPEYQMLSGSGRLLSSLVRPSNSLVFDS